MRPGLSCGLVSRVDGGATDGPRIGSTEQLAKGSIWRSRDSHRRLPPEVSGLQHFYRLVSPATFPPTECLMTPVSYSPRAVLRASVLALTEDSQIVETVRVCADEDAGMHLAVS